MSDKDRSAHPSWFKIGAIGCASVVGVVVLLLGGVVGLTFWGYKGALDARERLDRQYGTLDEYRVPVDGAIPADRVERFLEVRRALMPRCSEVTEVTGSFKAVDRMAGESEPDTKQLFRGVGRILGHLPSMGFVFGEYVSDRNDALLARQMGMGEYTWIYLTGYFGYLGQPPERVLNEKGRPTVYRDRVFPAAARIIQQHVTARSLTSGPWVEELARLAADPDRVPFRGTLPPELAASFEPFHAALAAAACPASAELDLTLTVRRSTFGYDHR